MKAKLILMMILLSGLAFADCGPAAKTYNADADDYEGKLCAEGQAQVAGVMLENAVYDYTPVDGGRYAKDHCFRGKDDEVPGEENPPLCSEYPNQDDCWQDCYPRMVGGDYDDSSFIYKEGHDGNMISKRMTRTSAAVKDFNGIRGPALTNDKQKFFIPPGTKRYYVSTGHKAGCGSIPGGIAFARFGGEPEIPDQDTVEYAVDNYNEYRDTPTFDEYLSGDTFIIGRNTNFNFLSCCEDQVLPSEAGWLYVKYHSYHNPEMQGDCEYANPNNPGFTVSVQYASLTMWVNGEYNLFEHWYNQTGGDPTKPYRLAPPFPYPGKEISWECVKDDNVLSICEAERLWPHNLHPLNFLVQDKNALLSSR